MYLHPKHGLNPTLTTCYYCNEPADLLLVGSQTKRFKELGLASSDGEMKMNIGVIDARPCAKCQDYMQQGVILISMRDGEESEMETAKHEKRLANPYRTGGWIVVREEYIRRVIDSPILTRQILRQRVCFVPDSAWDKIGLPRGGNKTTQ